MSNQNTQPAPPKEYKFQGEATASVCSNHKIPVVPKKYLLPFILVTSLFALWGFANDITNPLVAVFKDVFVINNAQSSWVQMAFYGGYATMALPAALFIRRYSYKAGIMVGLALYAIGALLSIPAAAGANFNLFIVGLYVLTFGLAFLETTANPYILSMGDPSTATRRLNLAQAFNPIGSLAGMTVAVTVILSTIQVEDFKNDVNGYYAEAHPTTTEQKTQDLYILPFLRAEPRERTNDPVVKEYVATLDAGVEDVAGNALTDYKEGTVATFNNLTHTELQQHDLKIVALPYTILGCVVIGMLVVFFVAKMPNTCPPTGDHSLHFNDTVKRLFANPRYVGGVIAQTFYVGAQIMCWTFIIQYAETELGIDKATAQKHNIAAMVVFLCSRFICTFFLKYVSPGRLLMVLAIAAIGCTLGAIHLEGMAGLYSLMAISACMSLMFPTIYGIALEGLGSDAKLGSAGLIFAIVGGALMPRIQGGIMDMDSFMGTTATRGSFYLPLLSFVVIAIFGLYCRKPRTKPHGHPA
ncbi:MFS transporter [Sulfuriroseicoccus oceanibius]|uniref:MFS transporter n=1 Tax=Sulfuriroseicoccus oceanibius TaxID=2707525 RepID=A0A6B3LCG8_9BACT|nr:MFS transporter [Sulfuriroseicoccus oceanibius]QQL44729.1 MFS transporter [Sulfuriroseicoccus oceanibius]